MSKVTPLTLGIRTPNQWFPLPPAAAQWETLVTTQVTPGPPPTPLCSQMLGRQCPRGPPVPRRVLSVRGGCWGRAQDLAQGGRPQSTPATQGTRPDVAQKSPFSPREPQNLDFNNKFSISKCG